MNQRSNGIQVSVMPDGTAGASSRRQPLAEKLFSIARSTRYRQFGSPTRPSAAAESDSRVKRPPFYA
jgi:hypothetical protein